MPIQTDDWQTIALPSMDDNSCKTGVTSAAGRQFLHHKHTHGLGCGNRSGGTELVRVCRPIIAGYTISRGIVGDNCDGLCVYIQYPTTALQVQDMI